MQSHQLKRTNPNRKRMIVARGGKRGKTAGRGGKGQSARAGNKRRPEWRDTIKKIPKLRGRGVNQNKAFATKPIPVNLDVLEAIFSTNDSVTPTILMEKGIVPTLSGKILAIKILGEGEITKAIKVSGCFISTSAKEKIEKAGGSVVPFIQRFINIKPEKKVVKTEKKAEDKKVEVKKDEVKATKEVKEKKETKKTKTDSKVKKTSKA